MLKNSHEIIRSQINGDLCSSAALLDLNSPPVKSTNEKNLNSTGLSNDRQQKSQSSFIQDYFKSPINFFFKQYQAMSFRTRVLKETKQLQLNELPGVNIIFTDNLHLFYVDLRTFNNKLYEGQTFRLKIMIPENYPFVPPITIFVKNVQEGISAIPIHPHIYSNGHICLDLLGPAWTPIHSISSLVLSLQSFLAGNTSNTRPPDDIDYVARAPKDPSKTTFIYHDEKV